MEEALPRTDSQTVSERAKVPRAEARKALDNSGNSVEEAIKLLLQHDLQRLAADLQEGTNSGQSNATREIRAVFTDDTVRVYQAYNDTIADAVVAAQHFVDPLARGPNDMGEAECRLDGLP